MKIINQIIKVCIPLVIILTVQACDRRDYVTLQCIVENSPASKITMILEGPSLKMDQATFNYCGSIGPNSYFDKVCQTSPNNALITFNQTQGKLVMNQQVFQCQSL